MLSELDDKSRGEKQIWKYSKIVSTVISTLLSYKVRYLLIMGSGRIWEMELRRRNIRPVDALAGSSLLR